MNAGLKINGSAVSAIERILSISDFSKAFQNPDADVLQLQSAITANYPFGKYKPNSTRSQIAAIWAICKRYDSPLEVIDRWKKLLEIQEKIVLVEHQQKLENDKILDFKQYLDIMKKEYGEKSKEYVIAEFYSHKTPQTWRDDLQFRLRKTVTPEIESDPSSNYVVINFLEPRIGEDPTGHVYLNTYKTLKEYGRDVIELPKTLVNLILGYVAENCIRYNDYLFGKEPLSGFISKMNSHLVAVNKIPRNITINNFRQMRISKIWSQQVMTDEARQKLAKESKHAVLMTMTYIRIIERLTPTVPVSK